MESSVLEMHCPVIEKEIHMKMGYIDDNNKVSSTEECMESGIPNTCNHKKCKYHMDYQE